MDVTKQSFHQHLPRLLTDLSESCFVALDLEFSGIFTRRPGGGAVNGGSNGKQTLQSRYEEVKEAAEAYQILQIGLTFIKEDVKNGMYTLRPYNLHLSPLLDPKLDVERQWSYQSSAVDFLMGNGFSMHAPFMEGLPYLSRLEEATARERLSQRESNMAAITTIKCEDMDDGSLQFLVETRRQIDEWMTQGMAKDGFLNIPSWSSANNNKQINNYQKRLVHQLIRSEYPSLVSMGRAAFVQIIPFDEKREEEVRSEKIRVLQQRISQQTGFRWIVEGMAGGDLSNLDSRCFLQILSASRVSGEALFEHSRKLQNKLKAKRPILVGHNMFTDLVNFYRCFIGDLPDKVEDFQKAIHELFPMVIDTKYMATHNCSSSKPSSSLIELNTLLAESKTPEIRIDPDHYKYHSGNSLHEAGYDSLLTAQVLLRLSTQLHGEMAHSSRKESCKTYNFDHTLSRTSWTIPNASTPTHVTSRVDKLIDIDGRTTSYLNGGLKPTMLNGTGKGISHQRAPSQVPVNWNEAAVYSRIRSIFAHPTKFDLLTDQTDEIVTYRSPSPGPGRSLLDFNEDNGVGERKAKGGQLITRFDNDFWKVYGNKLRVFGTIEELCDLNC
ncbi:hypothetical protein AJ80_02194 [Polytolypa hystricis UAMH7299]|uniref:Uncharacterized protein n=1 Tax=Polytolypa hystricis (strain UAMH7299) TaxID=1447883 RepID=A0A2B7YI45_POLH7|nr:hypothetical protein AJ80_02194 [Polytolypa hystricis UAMH7299]